MPPIVNPYESPHGIGPADPLARPREPLLDAILVLTLFVMGGCTFGAALTEWTREHADLGPFTTFVGFLGGLVGLLSGLAFISFRNRRRR